MLRHVDQLEQPLPPQRERPAVERPAAERPAAVRSGGSACTWHCEWHRMPVDGATLAARHAAAAVGSQPRQLRIALAGENEVTVRPTAAVHEIEFELPEAPAAKKRRNNRAAASSTAAVACADDDDEGNAEVSRLRFRGDDDVDFMTEGYAGVTTSEGLGAATLLEAARDGAECVQTGPLHLSRMPGARRGGACPARKNTSEGSANFSHVYRDHGFTKAMKLEVDKAGLLAAVNAWKVRESLSVAGKGLAARGEARPFAAGGKKKMKDVTLQLHKEALERTKLSAEHQKVVLRCWATKTEQQRAVSLKWIVDSTKVILHPSKMDGHATCLYGTLAAPHTPLAIHVPHININTASHQRPVACVQVGSMS